MDEVKAAIEFAKENGFWGAVFFGSAVTWAAIKRRWVVTPAMADLQAENARLKALLDANKIEYEDPARVG